MLSRALAEAQKALTAVLEAEAYENIANELMTALDEGGYDVRISSLEELIADVEKLMLLKGVDESLLSKLKVGITRAKKLVGKTFQTAAHKDRLTKLSDRKSKLTADKQAQKYPMPNLTPAKADPAADARSAAADSRRRADSNQKAQEIADLKKRKESYRPPNPDDVAKRHSGGLR